MITNILILIDWDAFFKKTKLDNRRAFPCLLCFQGFLFKRKLKDRMLGGWIRACWLSHYKFLVPLSISFKIV